MLISKFFFDDESELDLTIGQQYFTMTNYNSTSNENDVAGTWNAHSSKHTHTCDAKRSAVYNIRSN